MMGNLTESYQTQVSCPSLVPHRNLLMWVFLLSSWWCL